MKKILNIMIMALVCINAVNAAHYTVKREVATVFLSETNAYTLNLKLRLDIKELWQKTCYSANVAKGDLLEKRYLEIVRSMDGRLSWNETEAAMNKEILLVVQALEFLVRYKSSYLLELYMSNRLVRDAEGILLFFDLGLPASMYLSNQEPNLSFREKIAIATQRLHPIAALKNRSALNVCKRMRDVILDTCKKCPYSVSRDSISVQYEALLEYAQANEHKINDIDSMLKICDDIEQAMSNAAFYIPSVSALRRLFGIKWVLKMVHLNTVEEFNKVYGHLIGRIEQ